MGLSLHEIHLETCLIQLLPGLTLSKPPLQSLSEELLCFPCYLQPRAGAFPKFQHVSVLLKDLGMASVISVLPLGPC